MMPARKTRRCLQKGKQRKRRGDSGIIIPLVAIALTAVLAELCLVTDCSTRLLASEDAEALANRTAVEALSNQCNDDGSFYLSDALHNMMQVANELRKLSPAMSSDISARRISASPGDLATECNVSVTMEPSLATAILKLIKNVDSEGENSLAENSIKRACRAVPQPAAMIREPASNRLKQFAVLPLAINIKDFAKASQPSESRRQYKIVVSESDESSKKSPPPDQIEGLFLAARTAGGTNNSTMLPHALEYFCGNAIRLPTDFRTVARGDSFRPLRSTRKDDSAWNSLKHTLSRLPTNHFYLLPVCVVANGRATAIVMGFARFKLTGPGEFSATNLAIPAEIADSVVSRTAVCELVEPSTTANSAQGRPTFAWSNSNLENPFRLRAYSSDESATRAHRGVVMAAALAPN